MLRIPYAEVQDRLCQVLGERGFAPERAQLCARLFAEASRDGVYSHGLHRFPRFIEMIRRGVVNVDAKPERLHTLNVLEQWDGHRGPGNLNAHRCMERAITLAREYGVGGVALQNTNHWMRGGSYGWQAADAGVIGICWTNTMPNLPPWGARECRLGNNPLVVAVPRTDGHVVLDMAMSQFSYGSLAAYRQRGESLPVPGGYDADGNLTRDAAAIETTKRPLPIGFWKGSGLSLMLDLLAALLSGGQATRHIADNPLQETGLSQVYIAIDPEHLAATGDADRVVDQIIAYTKEASPTSSDGGVRYPGEQTLTRRQQNMEAGIPVNEECWEEILAM